MTLGEPEVWALLGQLADRARAGRPLVTETAVALDPGGALREDPVGGGWLVIDPAAPRGWRGTVAPALALMLDLYVPLCVGPGSARLVIGHLAQSLDGRIATLSGRSRFISGAEDLAHAHRLRALFDAVLVGAATAEHDDPRLTTRLVPGRHPTRVVIDPERRLPPDLAVFSDRAAPTLLFCRDAGGATRHGAAELVALGGAGQLAPTEVLSALADRGLGRVFIEGGGVTISRFLAAGALDRLHVAVAPCIFGSGRPAVDLPAIEDLSGALSFEWRAFPLGRDVLFDCPLR